MRLVSHNSNMREAKKTNFIDPERDAERALEAVLAGENSTTAQAPASEVVDASVLTSSAETDEQVLEPIVPVGSRSGIRVLLIVDDMSVFDARSDLHTYIKQWSFNYDEVHVVAVTPTSYAPDTIRLATNVWIYPTCSGGYFSTIYKAFRIARTQLAFASGFRADIIYVLDAARLSFAGYLLGRRYKRPYVMYTSYDPFRALHRGWGDLRWFLERYGFTHTNGVHVRSHSVGVTLAESLPRHIPITLLPQYYDMPEVAPDTGGLSVQTPYGFTLVAVCLPLKEKNPVFAINICAPIMDRYATVGLVIVGDEFDRHAIEKRIKEEHLTGRISYLPMQHLADAFAHAHLLIQTSVHEDYEPILALAAVSGLPILTSPLQGGGIVFEDRVSALLCAQYDASCYLPRIEQFLSNNEMRISLAQNARELVKSMYVGSLERHMSALCESLTNALSVFGR